jgi:hypothetical protein
MKDINEDNYKDFWSGNTSAFIMNMLFMYNMTE